MVCHSLIRSPRSVPHHDVTRSRAPVKRCRSLYTGSATTRSWRHALVATALIALSFSPVLQASPIPDADPGINAIPVISQVKSFGQWITGDAKGALETQEEFSKQCPIVSQIRSAVEAACGDMEAARKTQEEFAKGMGEMADSIPVVGHIKGGVHYAMGDNAQGDASMKAASKSTVVIGAGILGGPAAAVGASVAMDGVITGADSAAHGGFRPYGLVQAGKNIADGEKVFDNVFDAGTGLALDAAGAKGAKTAWKTKKAVSKQVAEHNIQLTNIRKALPTTDSKVSKAVVGDIVEAARNLEKAKLDGTGHVSTIVKDADGNVGAGFSKRARDQIRKESGQAGQPDPLHPGKGFKRNYDRETLVVKDPFLDQSKSPLVQEHQRARKQGEGAPLKQFEENRAIECCAEHAAARDLAENHGAVPQPSGKGKSKNVVKERPVAETVSVQLDRDMVIRTVERCANCAQFTNMGQVWTDGPVAGKPVPTRPLPSAGEVRRMMSVPVLSAALGTVYNDYQAVNDASDAVEASEDIESVKRLALDSAKQLINETESELVRQEAISFSQHLSRVNEGEDPFRLINTETAKILQLILLHRMAEFGESEKAKEYWFIMMRMSLIGGDSHQEQLAALFNEQYQEWKEGRAQDWTSRRAAMQQLVQATKPTKDDQWSATSTRNAGRPKRWAKRG